MKCLVRSKLANKLHVEEEPQIPPIHSHHARTKEAVSKETRPMQDSIPELHFLSLSSSGCTLLEIAL